MAKQRRRMTDRESRLENRALYMVVVLVVLLIALAVYGQFWGGWF